MVGPSYMVVLNGSTAGDTDGPDSAGVFVDGGEVGSTRFVVADTVTGPEQRDDTSATKEPSFLLERSDSHSKDVEVFAQDVEEVWELDVGLGGTPELELVEDEDYTDWYY